MKYCETCRDKYGYPMSNKLEKCECEKCKQIDNCYEVNDNYVPKESTCYGSRKAS